MKLAEKHFGGIPSRPLPPRPDISEPPQTAEKIFTESDKLARTPAVAFGYHLPERMTKDFFALSLLDPLLVSDESAKLYQALIKENQIASDVSGGFNYGLGNNFDYNGPMLYTFRVDYRPDLKGADVLKVVDKVISAVQEHGITEDELRQAKVNFRSSFLENLESQARLRPRRSARGAGALRRRSEPHQHHPQRPRQGDGRRGAAGGEEIPDAREPDVDRSPAGRGCEVTRTCITALRNVACRCWSLVARPCARAVPSRASPRQERPAVGPERPFQLAPRVERTLPNGLRVIVTRQTAMPKVSITLTVLSGYSSDPADLTGLAIAHGGPDPGRDEDQEQPADPARGLRHGRLAVGGRVAGLSRRSRSAVCRSSRRG